MHKWGQRPRTNVPANIYCGADVVDAMYTDFLDASSLVSDEKKKYSRKQYQ